MPAPARAAVLRGLMGEGERERSNGSTDSRVEALWGHAITAFWDSQLGIRHDSGAGPHRDWIAAGVQGLAPGWLDVEATLYLGESGRSAARIRASYEFRFTQRLYLAPEAEANAYGKSDPARDVGSGLANVRAGLRLRYEITRRFAPYIGVEWERSFGETANFLRTSGESTNDRRLVAGVRLWF